MFDPNYYLLAVLDDDSQARLEKLSATLTEEGYEYTRYTPYHITLWGGGKPSEDWLNQLETVCNKTAAISLSLCSVGLFGLAVLFLSPLPSKPLINLEEQICGELDDAPVGWAPHITLRIGKPDYISHATPIAAEGFEPFRCRIERVALYECGEDYANLVKSFSLHLS